MGAKRARRRTIGAIVLILAVALGARLATVMLTRGLPPTVDAVDYDRHGYSIARGQGYPPSIVVPRGGPSAFRPPLYPLAVAAVYTIAGVGDHRITAARAAQAVGGTALVGLLGLLAYRLWGDRRVAFAVLVLAAVYPPLIMWGALMLSEALFVFLVVSLMLLVLRCRRARRPVLWAAAVGVATGLAILTRPNGAVLLLPAVVGISTVRLERSVRRILPAVALVAMAALVVGPWVIRNTLVFHRFVPLTTQSGFGLTGQYNDDARTDTSCRACWRPTSRQWLPILRDPFADEAETDQRVRAAIFRYVLDHPGYPAVVGFWNTVRLLQLDGPSFNRSSLAAYGFGPRSAALYSWSFYAAAALAVFGVRLARLRGPRFLWLAVPLLIASTVFIASEPRYRAPIEPFVLLLAAAGAVRLLDLARGRAPAS